MKEISCEILTMFFEPDQPHPDTPPSVLEEQGYEVRDYSGDDDDKAHDETWKKLEKRRAEKREWKTLVMPDPEAEGETLTVIPFLRVYIALVAFMKCEKLVS